MQEATTIVAINNKLVQHKGKRKAAEDLEAEQSCKMKVDPLLEKEYLVVEAKREQ